jgi:adenosylcobinamide-GDP ribazoletransferase
VYFPIAGAIVGALGAGVFWLAAQLWPQSLAVIAAVATTVLVTGALHEDGLADAADGFGGGRTPDRIIEIMKDSRIGTYGAVALILVIVTKLAALASLSRSDVVAALIAGHTLARWSSVALLYRSTYVGTKGVSFAGGVTPGRLVVATVLTAVLIAAVLQRRAIIVGLVAVLVTAVAGTYFRRRLGGITGDCLGAANQLVEVTVYAVVAATTAGSWAK